MSMDHPIVIDATEADLRAACRNALRRCGLSRDQLLAEHRDGIYSSTRARLAWVAVGDLLADPTFVFEKSA